MRSSSNRYTDRHTKRQTDRHPVTLLKESWRKLYFFKVEPIQKISQSEEIRILAFRKFKSTLLHTDRQTNKLTYIHTNKLTDKQSKRQSVINTDKLS